MEKSGKTMEETSQRVSALHSSFATIQVVQQQCIWIFLCLLFVVVIHPVSDINLCLIDQKAADPRYVNVILISSLQVAHWFSACCLLELWSSLFFEENIKERGAGGGVSYSYKFYSSLETTLNGNISLWINSATAWSLKRWWQIIVL